MSAEIKPRNGLCVCVLLCCVFFLPTTPGVCAAGTMTEKRVKLKSSDDEMFEVEEAVAFESQTVKNMIEDTGVDHPIPLPNVSSKILAKVIEYCKYHVDNQKSTDDKPATPEDEVKAWDQDFVKVDQATLFDLILVSFSHLFPIWISCCCGCSRKNNVLTDDAYPIVDPILVWAELHGK